nr:ChaC-like family protein [Tanacetum cinerariifolium]
MVAISKEEEVQKISTSIFITNFPDHAKTKDLWNICKQYGQVVDAFISDRKSKAEACEPALLLDESCLNQLDYSLGKRFSVRAKETTRWIPDFDEQEEDNSESEDEQSVGFIKEDFDGSDAEKEGNNSVSMVPDSVTEDANVQAEEKGNDLDVNNS